MLSRASIRSFSASASASIKVSARDAPGSLLSSVSVVVNNAGSKASSKAGVAHLLSKYNFLNTESKSALRFTRESELLGGSFSTQVTRDAIVLNTQFLKEDLPFYVEALGNVLAKPSFRPHEFVETVLPVAKAEYEVAAKDPKFLAVEELHSITFRKGLGAPLYFDGKSSVSLEDVTSFAQSAYTAGNVSIFASGVNEADLSGFISGSALSSLPTGTSSSAATTSFVGKESRSRAVGPSVAVIGVPVKPADFAKYEILSAAIGSAHLSTVAASPLSQLPGSATSQLLKYQDAGLFVVSVSDANASVVASSIKAAKKIIDSVSTKDASAAVKNAQLAVALESTFANPVDVKIDASTSAPKVEGFNYVAYGDIDVLPFADEL
ncbi:cytochrome b-c1 complex subunit 2, mitochondrial [[Candida] anglica]|uniref:Cytochrome b-c1 complex subunit 2, mitochondrial n=1 Tax=[Candida] anglica TaxID=148631 RepID=A0ABP0EF92_9ASCO